MIADDDLAWLKNNYPGVYYVSAKDILQGCIWFRMGYSLASGEGMINPPDDLHREDFLVLEDAYDLTINIDFAARKVIVMEIGGRILRTKNRWRLGNADVHMYSDLSLCLCPEPEEKLLFHEGFSLRRLFYYYLIPYLYYQSYLGKFGKEPWKSSSHGELGILESYNKQIQSEPSLAIIVDYYLDSLSPSLANLITAKKKIDVNVSCLCGSGKDFRHCHVSGYKGLTKLKKDYCSAKTKKPQERLDLL